jgi:hypothetical protein
MKKILHEHTNKEENKTSRSDAAEEDGRRVYMSGRFKNIHKKTTSSNR